MFLVYSPSNTLSCPRGYIATVGRSALFPDTLRFYPSYFSNTSFLFDLKPPRTIESSQPLSNRVNLCTRQHLPKCSEELPHKPSCLLHQTLSNCEMKIGIPDYACTLIRILLQFSLCILVYLGVKLPMFYSMDHFHNNFFL